MLLIFPHAESWPSGFNLGLGYLASVLEAKGRRPKIIDCQIARDYEQEILRALKKYSSVGISVNIATVSSALNISRLIRKASPKTKIIMGGVCLLRQEKNAMC
jgi:hypothetical protein